MAFSRITSSKQGGYFTELKDSDNRSGMNNAQPDMFWDDQNYSTDYKRTITRVQAPGLACFKKRTAFSHLPYQNIVQQYVVLPHVSKNGRYPFAVQTDLCLAGDIVSLPKPVKRPRVDEDGLSEYALYIKSLTYGQKDPAHPEEYYARDILAYLKEQELRYCMDPKFLELNSEITRNIRSILIDWLLQIEDFIGMSEGTLHKAVTLVDRFLIKSKKRVDVESFQLLGITALFLASKVDEHFPPKVDLLIKLTDNSCTYEQVLATEWDILQVLNFNVNPPVAEDFFTIYLNAALFEDDSAEQAARYLLDLYLTDIKVLAYVPSQRAAAAIYLTKALFGMSAGSGPVKVFGWTPARSVWTKHMENATGYKEVDILPCVSRLAVLLLKLEKSKFQAARNKYGKDEFNKVSYHPALSSFAVHYFASLTT